MKCFGSSKAIDTCRVEKMGCPGCAYYKNKVEEVEETEIPEYMLKEEDKNVHI